MQFISTAWLNLLPPVHLLAYSCWQVLFSVTAFIPLGVVKRHRICLKGPHSVTYSNLLEGGYMIFNRNLFNTIFCECLCFIPSGNRENCNIEIGIFLLSHVCIVETGLLYTVSFYIRLFFQSGYFVVFLPIENLLLFCRSSVSFFSGAGWTYQLCVCTAWQAFRKPSPKEATGAP